MNEGVRGEVRGGKEFDKDVEEDGGMNVMEKEGAGEYMGLMGWTKFVEIDFTIRHSGTGG